MEVIVNKICKSFTEHPKLAGENYWQHLGFTIVMSARLIGSGIALIIHGLLPFLFVHTASDAIRECNGILDERAVKTTVSNQIEA